jgi:hypothetical protein
MPNCTVQCVKTCLQHCQSSCTLLFSPKTSIALSDHHHQPHQQHTTVCLPLLPLLPQPRLLLIHCASKSSTQMVATADSWTLATI